MEHIINSNKTACYIEYKRVNTIISELKELSSIWHVGLYHGSLLHIEMGEKLLDKKYKGPAGSVSLTVEADEWTMIADSVAIVNSYNIDRRDIQNHYVNFLMGKRLISIDKDDESNLSIKIGRDIIIKIWDNSEKSDNISTLYLNDETIIVFYGNNKIKLIKKQ